MIQESHLVKLSFGGDVRVVRHRNAVSQIRLLSFRSDDWNVLNRKNGRHTPPFTEIGDTSFQLRLGDVCCVSRDLIGPFFTTQRSRISFKKRNVSRVFPARLL
jgi:hypothetical protein